MIKKSIFISFLFLVFIGCKPTKTYTDFFAPLRTDNILMITIEFHSDSSKKIAITNKQEIIDFVTNINNSKVNGPWKGAFWDKIILHYEDGEKIFNTNGEVFGQGSNSTFYDLNDRYKKYWLKIE